MADDPGSDQLREMAEHRGLKLIRSRRRKPGTGDFGKYGLSDLSGKALLGIGDDGLTATAEDIESYLRTGALSTWQQSADVEPDRPPAKLKSEPAEDADEADDDRPVRRKTRSTMLSAPKRKSKPLRVPIEAPAESKKVRPAPEPKAPPAPKLEPAPEPELSIRPAKPGDAAALAPLLSQLTGISTDGEAVAANLAALRKAGAGLFVAELAGVVGCCGWAVVSTIHRGPVGRVTMLVVDEDHRRRGIATKLLAAAEKALAAKGCSLVEVMSDIEIKNAHNFFRALKFDQTSYRFARKIGDGTSSAPGNE